MMLDTVLFEFEGVLAETRSARCAALTRSLGDDGFVLDPADFAERCAGLPVGDSVDAALQCCAGSEELDDTARALVALRAQRYFAEAVSEGLTMAAGARLLVDSMAGRARLAVVSRASRRDIDCTLALAGLDGAFECIVAADDVRRAKPAADGYVRALANFARRRTFGPPPSVVAIEDSAPGIVAARASGVRVVAVGPLPAHEALLADGYIASLDGQSLESLGALIASGAERTR